MSHVHPNTAFRPFLGEPPGGMPVQIPNPACPLNLIALAHLRNIYGPQVPHTARQIAEHLAQREDVRVLAMPAIASVFSLVHTQNRLSYQAYKSHISCQIAPLRSPRG